ncbi:MAG: DUF364 domain-containing protein [Oscillospiraceae bacterium]|nr:DUF364 domain-containing protein [Oscillospiraceae bacterium]
MWTPYNDLYMGIPSGIRVDGCVVGKRWIAVRANGNVGLAPALGQTGEDRKELAQSFLGMHLREAANVLRWDSLTRASIGVAAMNAFYNIPGRTVPNARGALLEGLAGKEVSLIGRLPRLEAGLQKTCELTVLPLPERGRADAACARAMAGESVVLSGDALISGALADLMALAGPDTKITLAGPAVPAAPVMFAFDNPVRSLYGVCAVDGEAAERAARLDLEELGDWVSPFRLLPKKPCYLHQRPQQPPQERAEKPPAVDSPVA